MAAYAVVTYATPIGTLEVVQTALETKLETLDSTTNALRLIDIYQLAGDAFRGVLIYNG